jgi:ABC-type nickel/cobalt efflux system permease component RcnA
MVALLSIIALGFFLGMRHATDPDHVIAVTTIVTGQRNLRRSALIGAFWGIGHSLTILVVGAVIILFDLVVPARIGLSMELSVAIMLVVLGAMNLNSFFRAVPVNAGAGGPEEEDAHSGGLGDEPDSGGHGKGHTHFHSHGADAHHHSLEETSLARWDRALGRWAVYRPVRPLLIGIVHGLAGSAAVALLVLTTIHNPYWATAYLLVFGLGTIAGMMLITMSVATTAQFVGKSRVFSRRLAVVAGVLSLGFGLFLAYRIVFLHGLLSANPQWTPS